MQEVFFLFSLGSPASHNCRPFWKSYNGSCYYFGTKKATWPEAEVKYNILLTFPLIRSLHRIKTLMGSVETVLCWNKLG